MLIAPHIFTDIIKYGGTISFLKKMRMISQNYSIHCKNCYKINPNFPIIIFLYKNLYYKVITYIKYKIHMYVSAKQACEYFKVSDETLRLWTNDGKISYIKTTGGHRRYLLPTTPRDQKRNFIYARVSSRKQETELENQVEYLRKRYPSYEIITDIGSGLNFKRTGFQKILDELYIGNIAEVVVASSDRWARFGTKDFFKELFYKFSGKLTILENSKFKNPEVELSEDLLEIITVFSARYYGRRKYNNKKNQNISESESEEAV
jgi:excisionase family DNA binding protein